jgi:tetratricopeptide (TPR) repeat protein
MFGEHTARSIAAATLLVGMAAVSCTRNPVKAGGQFVNQGDRYLAEGKLEAADIEYRNAVRLLPSSAEVHARLLEVARRRRDAETVANETLALADLRPGDFALQMQAGELHARMGHLEDAEAAFGRAAAADSAKSAPHRALALLYGRQSKIAKAETEWQAVVASADGDPFALADFHAAQGRYQDAEAELRSLIPALPTSDAARLRLARVLHAAGRREDADRILQTLIASDPRNPTPWLLRGELLLRDKKPDEAKRAYSAAMRIDPESLAALTALTRIDLEAGRKDESIGRLRRSVAGGAVTVPVLLLAGRGYEAAGDLEAAEQTFQRAVELEPGALDAYHRLGELYVREGRLSAARDQFAEIAERRPADVSARTMIGVLLEADHRSADARAAYEGVLKQQPRAAVAANNLAWLYLDESRIDEALSYARVAQAELPQLPQTNDTLGWIYYLKKSSNEAIRLLSQAAERQPDNPVYHFHLGMAYSQAGSVAAARTELAQALATPTNFRGREEAERTKARLDAATTRPE